MPSFTPVGSNGGSLPFVRPGSMLGLLNLTDTAVTSNSVNCDAVMFIGTVDYHYTVGTNPTATLSSFLVPAGVQVVIPTKFNEKVSFIKEAGESDGTLYLYQVQSE